MPDHIVEPSLVIITLYKLGQVLKISPPQCIYLPLQLGVMLYIISDPHNMAFFIVGLIDTGANVVACSWDKAEHWCL